MTDVAVSLLRGAADAAPPSVSAVDLHARASADFDAKLQDAVATLRAAAAAGPVKQASSLGAEDMVITHLINHHALTIPIFVLDTGLLHAETLKLLEQLQAQQATHPHAPIEVYRPVTEAAQRFVACEGQDAMYRSIALRKACCGIRKMEPLARALAGQVGWITGLRREQSSARAEVTLIDRSEEPTRGLVKYSPLADWTWGDVWHYIALHRIAYNPLHDRFYPSIGCAPCTRAVTLGEDFRSGRWWWEAEGAKECGLHVKTSPPGSSPSPIGGRQGWGRIANNEHMTNSGAVGPHPNPPPTGEGDESELIEGTA